MMVIKCNSATGSGFAFGSVSLSTYIGMIFLMYMIAHNLVTPQD